MTTLFAICAAVGGTVIAFQFVLTLLGLTDFDDLPDDVPSDPADFPGDIDHPHFEGHTVGHGEFSSWLFSVISFRTIIAALAFFGITGMGFQSAGFDALPTLAAAVAAGIGAMLVVHKLMQTLARLRADGTVRVQRAVGQLGTVYLRVPSAGNGMGKVNVQIQNQVVELNALSTGEALPTGARVTVTRVINSDTVEVAAAETLSGVQHA